MQSTWKRSYKAQLVVGLIALALLAVSCAVPATTAPASEAASAAPQFSVTPPASEEVSTTVAAPVTASVTSASITESAPSAITNTMGASVGGLPGGKDNALDNVDTATNQVFAEWLATTGVTVAGLTPDIRAASPTVTVTVVLLGEGAAGQVKEALLDLDAVVLAEAGTMLSIQLPVGQLDQLAQTPGILLVQAPSVAPILGNSRYAPDGAQGFPVVSFGGLTVQDPNPTQPDSTWTTEQFEAWTKSPTVNWDGLAEIERAKANYLAKADTAVNQAYQEWQGQVTAAGMDAAEAAATSAAIVVTLVMQDEAAANAAKPLLANVNAQLLDAYGEWLAISVPVDQVAALVELPGLVLAQQPAQRPPIALPDDSSGQSAPDTAQSYTPEAGAGTNAVVTQGVAKSRVNVWHSAGFRGKGVRVAVMDSFDQAMINQAFAAGEIPTSTLSGPSTEDVSHGIAVAEIVYDMAPQATLTLHSIDNAPDYCIAVANKVDALAKAGHDIITSSIGPTFCTSAGDGSTNPMAQMARKALYDYNALYLQAAGNHARHHFEGGFQPVVVEDNFVVEDFSGDGATVNILSTGPANARQPAPIPAGYVLRFYLRWDGGWPQSNQDYDIFLVFWDGARWQFLNCTLFPCFSQDVQDGNDLPVERIETFAPFSGYYGLVIRKFRADSNHFLDLLTNHAQPGLAFTSPSRSLVAAASYEHVYAVAAVDVNSLALEDYSSQGPTYGPGNAPNGGFAQPQIAGFANVNTFIAPGFNGTSAATPHVAGAAAVLKSAAPCLTSRQLGDWLQQYATDKGAAGYDFAYGSGVLNFPAVSARPSCVRTKMYMPNLEK